MGGKNEALTTLQMHCIYIFIYTLHTLALPEHQCCPVNSPESLKTSLVLPWCPWFSLGSLSVLSDSTGSPKAVLVRPVRGGKPPGKQAQQQEGTVDPATSSLVLNWSFQRYMMMC